MGTDPSGRAAAGAGAPCEATCALCAGAGGELVVEHVLFRVVLADEPGVPGFTRVVLRRHAGEMTDLDEAERARLMAAVWTVERTMREVLIPDKVNLASFGNQVPHLHWHVVPRWRDDPWFPAPTWAPAARAPLPLDGSRAAAAHRLAPYREALRAAFGR